MFEPVFTITAAIEASLLSIEADRQSIDAQSIDIEMLKSLRETARLMSTHYSTQIDGNRLTQTQVRDALAGACIPGRERDEVEVRNHYRAMGEVEKLAASSTPILEQDIQRIHGLVMHGRPVLSPYRDGQNVIRDRQSGDIVYMPPEAQDVHALMSDLFSWLNLEMLGSALPPPVIAALGHYQFATIHPYYDGNGRTARLITNLILHKARYGLKGIYNLDEYYAQNLSAYYRELSVGSSHNYYLGRAQADVTGFAAYFCEGMAHALATVRLRAEAAETRGASDQSPLLRRLDPRQRRLLTLFRRHGSATTAEIAKHLGLSTRTVAELCRSWVAEGLLELRDPSRKNRAYQLGSDYEALVAGGEA